MMFVGALPLLLLIVTTNYNENDYFEHYTDYEDSFATIAGIPSVGQYPPMSRQPNNKLTEMSPTSMSHYHDVITDLIDRLPTTIENFIPTVPQLITQMFHNHEVDRDLNEVFSDNIDHLDNVPEDNNTRLRIMNTNSVTPPLHDDMISVQMPPHNDTIMLQQPSISEGFDHNWEDYLTNTTNTQSSDHQLNQQAVSSVSPSTQSHTSSEDSGFPDARGMEQVDCLVYISESGRFSY